MDIGEYRKSLIKKVKLPSGFTFIIKQMTPKVFVKVMSYLPKTTATETTEFTEMATDALFENFEEITNVLFPECILDPKVISGTGDDKHLGTDELSFADAQTLLFEIFGMSEVLIGEEQQEAMSKRQLFRS